MIRNARHGDIESLVDLASTMHQESWFAKYMFNREKVGNVIRNLIDSPDGFVIVYEEGGELQGGFVGGIAEHFFGECRYAFDLGVFVKPEKRGSLGGAKLIREYVAQAIERGVDEVLIANSTGIDTERVAALFERLGFVRTGANFRMDVGGIA